MTGNGSRSLSSSPPNTHKHTLSLMNGPMPLPHAHLGQYPALLQATPPQLLHHVLGTVGHSSLDAEVVPQLGDPQLRRTARVLGASCQDAGYRYSNGDGRGR